MHSQDSADCGLLLVVAVVRVQIREKINREHFGGKYGAVACERRCVQIVSILRGSFLFLFVCVVVAVVVVVVVVVCVCVCV